MLNPCGRGAAGFPRTLGIACLACFILVTAAVPGVHAQTGERTRQALREHYRYNDGMTVATNEAPPSAADGTTTAGEPDVISMPVFEVDVQNVPRGLEQAIANAPVAPKKPGKLGTGVIQKDFGKVRMQAVTVLYIPIYIGFGW